MDKEGIMGRNTKYGIVGHYGLDVEHTPPEIVSKKKKKQLWLRWVDPKEERSDKDERAAVARYWGGWEEGSGLLFDSDVWQRRIHLISPLWDDDKTPSHLTLWRVIDHAPRAGINVCGWFAVGPRYAAMYRLLYERGLEITQFAEKIIEMSHNRRVFDGERRDEVTGSIHPHYREEQVGEVFYGGTIMDSRSMANSLQNETFEEIYNRCGIQDLRPASGQHDDVQIPRLKTNWMWIDFQKPHPWNKDEDGKPLMGCPNLFVFAGRCDDFVNEVEGLQQAPPGAAGLINKKNPHHAVDVAKYWASDNPCYMGDDPKDYDEGERRGNQYTGY